MTTPTSLPDSSTLTTIVESILREVREQYLFPDVAAEIETAIRARLDNNEYHSLPLGDVCAALTEHMQAVSGDKHLRVFYTEDPGAKADVDATTPEAFQQFRLTSSFSNFGFQKAEILPGNIGYLDIRRFELAVIAGETAVTAMSFLAHTSALIVDLRQNRGGFPETVAIVTSYLFDMPVHLNTMHSRADLHMQQYWTLPYVPGRRYGDKPVFVLTSRDTFSGGEEFAYNLKHLKRATIIGEVTRGGAHPGKNLPITEQIKVFIPMSRAINPISGANWEGSGVTPDIEQPQEQALQTAYELALRQVLEQIGDTPSSAYTQLRAEIQNILTDVKQHLPA